jgi:hypothetical protein
MLLCAPASQVKIRYDIPVINNERKRDLDGYHFNQEPAQEV